jgi:hypothetical protein
VVFFTKFSQQKRRKDLERIGKRMYLCPPAKNGVSEFFTPVRQTAKRFFCLDVKVFRIGKKVLVGMKKRLALHSQSKNGHTKHSSLRFF